MGGGGEEEKEKISGMEADLQELALLVNGCRDDTEGRKAKRSIVESFLARTSGNAFSPWRAPDNRSKRGSG